MSESNVSINWKTGDEKNDRQIGRYRRCLYEFVKELSEVKEAKELLKKYGVEVLDNPRIGLDFPSDFDQKKLPEELR